MAGGPRPEDLARAALAAGARAFGDEVTDGLWKVHDEGLALSGIRVLDAGTVIAGPGIAARLGDFGADVIKVEHPRGDSLRTMGWTVGDVALWSKWIDRNKRPVTLDLSRPKGRDLLLRLAASADVLIESFRPGTLERWGLGPPVLMEANPRLIVARCSGFGQTGPYRAEPGFGTLAESISGLAHMTGFPDGPPMLPPIALADEATSLLGAYAVMVALYRREAGRGGGDGGQVIDLSLFESLFPMTGPIPAAYDLLGDVPGRIGNRIAYSAPRGVYETNDGRWVGISGSAESVARRLLLLIGGEALADDPHFATNNARLRNVDELDRLIAAWTGRRSLDEALEALKDSEVAVAPVYDIAHIVSDPHYAARGALVRVPDDQLGEVLMAAPRPLLSDTPGTIRHAGLPKGHANAEVYGALGLSEEERSALRDERVI
jgi:crotonobetainyl-CoA:carnitine CoA-transferase CaiB-like acyl-CoA transferase